MYSVLWPISEHSRWTKRRIIYTGCDSCHRGHFISFYRDVNKGKSCPMDLTMDPHYRSRRHVNFPSVAVAGAVLLLCNNPARLCASIVFRIQWILSGCCECQGMFESVDIKPSCSCKYSIRLPIWADINTITISHNSCLSWSLKYPAININLKQMVHINYYT